LLAVCCTTVNEWISGLLKMRSRLLLEGITQLLTQGDASTAAKVIEAFYGHPLIRGLMRKGQHPSYLSARAFATAIMDIATPHRTGAITFDDLLAGIKNDLPESGLRTSLLALLQNTDRTVQGAQFKIEAWYDDAMDRVSGWYKRKTQIWTLIVASILTIATNADTLHVARQLWIEPALRNALATSQEVQLMRPAGGDKEAMRTNAAQLLGEVIGWRDLDQIRDPWTWPERLLGWILSIIAVSLGAPFWFDALKRFMNLRAAGRSPVEFGLPPQKPSAPVITP
ncbi:MAG: hypothetical protein JO185_23735, partial [Acidobacteriaceae bacterium]|nr:hypothetical protein [Acidobacteriaceae bacterium]